MGATMSEHNERGFKFQRAKHPTDGAYDFAVVATIDDHKHVIAECFGRVGEATFVAAEGHARLFAAAPDMLKALTIALGFIEELEADHRSRTKTGDTIRAAIAKARGETDGR